MKKNNKTKRILALVLCICMMAACWPASSLQATSALYTGESTGVPAYTLNGMQTTIYYEDDFTTEAGYAAALGTYVDNASKLIWADEALTMNASSTSSTQNAIFNGIQDATNLQNYSVCANVSVGSANKFTSVGIYAQEGSTSGNKLYAYEFTIGRDSTGLYFRLGRRDGSSLTTLNDLNNETCKKYLNAIDEFKDYSEGAITVKISAATDCDNNVKLTCSATLDGQTVELFSATDSSTSKYVSGTAAFRSTDTEVIIDDILVSQESENTDYLYKDDFSSTSGYKEALGTPNNGNLSLENNALLIDAQTKHVSLFKGVENAETLQNYTISADFVFDDTDGYNGVVAYGTQHPTTTNDSYGYEFAIVSGKFRLYRRDSEATDDDTLAGSTSADAVTTVFENEKYAVGDEITLSLTAVTDYDDNAILTCKATYKGVEKTLYTYTDKSDSKISCGIPGLRGTNEGCTVDDVYITEEAAPGITIPFTETFDRTQEKLATIWDCGADITVEEIDDNNQAVLGAANIKNMYLVGGEKWTNYVYEADVTMTQTICDNSTVRVSAICGATNNNSAGYEFGLLYNESLEQQCWVRLYDRAAGMAVGVGVTATKTGQEPYDFVFGEAVHLKMEIEGNNIRCYANDTLLITYEAEEGTIFTGGIGIRVNGYQAQYDNLSVTVAGAISIPEVETTVELYQGFELSPYDYTVDVTYANGDTENVPMTFDMIEEYDNETAGDREVTINYEGKVTTIPITILERPEYIQEFVDLVNECGVATDITLDDKETVELLEEMHQSLSGYELSIVDETVLENYNEVIEALYKLEHAELAEHDMVYANNFNDALAEEWTSVGSGTWRTLNGVLINEQERYGWNDKVSYVMYAPFYGEVNSVEADVMLTSENGMVSLLSNVSDIGYYHVRLRKATLGYNVQLYKYVSDHIQLGEQNLILKGITIKVEEWHNIRLTNDDGLLTVYVDDKEVLQYDDSESSNCMTTGTFGFRSLNGDMRYDSLRVMGTAMSEELYVPQIESTFYEDDFENEDDEVGGNPSHWIEETSSNNWKLYEKNGSLVYGTTSNALTYTWLHTFESDPTVAMDFMVENITTTGRIEFLTRYTQAVYSYAGIGYDFEQSKWYIYTARGEDFKPQILYADEKFELTAVEWYSLKIEENGKNIKVYVDDELVLEETNAYMTGYGRIGVLSENVNLYIDNLFYTMPHGGNVDDGVIEYIFDDALYGFISHLEIESLGGDTLIGVNSGKQYLSTDNGATWTKTTAYPDVQGKGLGYPSILEISEGIHIMVYADTFEVYKSTDYMKNWTKIGQVITDVGDNLSDGGTWENIIHVNALTKVTLDDGTVRIFLPVGMRRFNSAGSSYNGHYTRVFYSDDGGVTWKESENDTRDIMPNYTDSIDTYFSWTESKIIKCSDGTLRMYNTRSYDCVVYTESYDNGVTWERLQSISYLQNGQTSYSVAEDPENIGTYYMVCLNAKAIMYNSMQPRNRLSLVKSTDGKNWEFVTDIERFTSFSGYENAELYQIIDPSISIINGYMYVTMGRSYNGSTSAHGEQSVLLVRLEMDKLTETSKWGDSNIADSARPEKLEMETLPKTIYEVCDTFTIDGGVVKQTAFNGKVSYVGLNRFELVGTEPDMNETGIYTVTMMNRYAQYVSYEIEVTEDATDYYEVSAYRKTSSYTYPYKEGYVFAGWYWDAKFEKPLTATDTNGRAHAKFVDANVLSVKAQLDANTTSTSETTRMRFVTTVDSLDYAEVGFTVSTTESNAKTYSSTKVYETLKAEGLEVDYEPKKEFSEESLYFATLILEKIKVAGTNIERAFTVTPYWVTLDGTTVKGITRNDITIQKGIDANDAANDTSSPYSLR